MEGKAVENFFFFPYFGSIANHLTIFYSFYFLIPNSFFLPFIFLFSQGNIVLILGDVLSSKTLIYSSFSCTQICIILLVYMKSETWVYGLLFNCLYLHLREEDARSMIIHSFINQICILQTLRLCFLKRKRGERSEIDFPLFPCRERK